VAVRCELRPVDRQAQLFVQTSDKPIERTHVVMPGLEEGRQRGPGGTVNRWRQLPVRLSPDGDVHTPAPVQPPIIALRDRDRYRLMTRYRLTPDQVDRVPADIAWTLPRLP
jgi:hypothetical protein